MLQRFSYKGEKLDPFVLISMGLGLMSYSNACMQTSKWAVLMGGLKSCFSEVLWCYVFFSFKDHFQKHHYLFIIQCQGSSILENKQFILAVSLTFKLEAHSSHTTKRVHLGPHWTEILTVKEGRYEVSTGFKLTQICHQELLQMNQEIKRIWPLIWIVLALNFIDALGTVKTPMHIYIYILLVRTGRTISHHHTKSAVVKLKALGSSSLCSNALVISWGNV